MAKNSLAGQSSSIIFIVNLLQFWRRLRCRKVDLSPSQEVELQTKIQKNRTMRQGASRRQTYARKDQRSYKTTTSTTSTHRSSSGPPKSEKVYSQHITLVVRRRLVEAQYTALSFPSPLSRPNTTFLLKKAVNWQQYQTPSRNS